MATPEIIPPSAASAPRYTVWRGPNGIRAGWRLLIFLALIAAMVLAVGMALRIFVHGQAQAGAPSTTPLGLAFIEGPLFFFTAVAALIMARIERRTWGQYGLPLDSAFGKDFCIGTAVGFAAISATLLAIFLLGGFRLTGIATHGSTLLSSILAWTAVFILVGLAEEFSFRGYLQFTLASGIGFWPAGILLSLMFGLAHAGNPGESKFGLISVVLFGLLFCLFLRRRGNLWWAVGFHAGWDWGQTFFYGVADSGQAPYHNLLNSEFSGAAWLTGGTVGPEASVFTPIVLGIVAILFARAYRESRDSSGS